MTIKGADLVQRTADSAARLTLLEICSTPRLETMLDLSQFLNTVQNQMKSLRQYDMLYFHTKGEVTPTLTS